MSAVIFSFALFVLGGKEQGNEWFRNCFDEIGILFFSFVRSFVRSFVLGYRFGNCLGSLILRESCYVLES